MWSQGIDAAAADRYMTRIAAPARREADIGMLRRLHAAHLYHVPFENLSIHLGEPIRLDPSGLVEKIVGRRRGGFCYELNGAFALLLEALGYRVTLLSARVWADGRFGPSFDHLALRVDCPDSWLVDVGFGAHSLYPLGFELNVDQADPDGLFRLVPVAEGEVDVLRNGLVQYRLELAPRCIAEFQAMCRWHQTAPESHFTRTLVCTRRTPEGRVTLSGDRLTRSVGTQRWETRLESDDAVLSAYRDVFGIRLDRLPHLPA
jgi:N-hydroxyarylamine O-acetyltransferase